MKYLRVYYYFIKLSLQRFFTFRMDFIVWSLVSTGWTLFSLLFYNILFLQTSSIAGWSKEQTYVLIATFLVVDSATWSIFWRNIQMYTEAIFSGTLDFLLVQPIDAQFRLSTRHLSFTNVPRLLIGIFLLFKYAHNVTLSQVLLYLVFISAALSIVYSIWFITATLVFWVEKMDNVVEIVPTIRRIWSVPADVYSGPLAALFTIALPLALITTVPTRVLLGTLQFTEVLILSIFTLVTMLCTRVFFRYSIKKYAGIGS